MEKITDRKTVEMKIGEQLQKRRKEKFKSQFEFAVALGIDERKTVGNWETGTVAIPIHRLPEICDLLDCDLDYIFGNIDVPHNITSDIIKETGLTETAVKKLRNCSSDFTDILSSLLENNNFWALIESIGKYREYIKDSLPIDLYLNYGMYAEMRENSSIHSINKRDFCLFQIQELIKIIAKDGVNNG